MPSTKTGLLNSLATTRLLTTDTFANIIVELNTNQAQAMRLTGIAWGAVPLSTADRTFIDFINVAIIKNIDIDVLDNINNFFIHPLAVPQSPLIKKENIIYFDQKILQGMEYRDFAQPIITDQADKITVIVSQPSFNTPITNTWFMSLIIRGEYIKYSQQQPMIGGLVAGR